MIPAILLLASAGLTVTLPAESHVSGTEVLLGDIARIESDSAQAREAAAALSLGYAPAPGYSRLLDAGRVATSLRAKLSEVDVRVIGASACRVWPVEERLSGEALASCAREELTRSLLGLDAELEPVDLPRELAVPKGSAPARLQALVERAPAESGSLTVPVKVLVDGLPYRTVSTNWRVRVYRTLPVLAQAVRAGEELGSHALETRRVEIVGAWRGLPLPASALVGTRATRDLAAGAPITALDVHRPAVMKHGDLVTLRVRKGGICAEARAIAKESGAVGDNVLVTVEAGRDLSALVVGPGLVEVDLSDKR